MFENNIENIKDLVSTIIEHHQAFLIDVYLKNVHKRKTIQIFVDTDAGITIDECAALSREISESLDLANIMNSPYDLEISSPGLDKPLRNIRQYPRNIGRGISVKYRQGEQIVLATGILESVDGTRITCKLSNGESQIIEFKDILETFVKLPW
jgi:ribosome maturation factor RimP